MRLLLFFFILIITVDVSTAQVEVLNAKKGLSNRDVTCIFQTTNGYMWFGTLNGLNRYDGYSLKEFNYKPGESNVLSNGKINCLLEGSDGRLWIGTDNGLNVLNQQTGEIAVVLKGGVNKTKNRSINSMKMDSGGRIFVGTGAGEVFKFSDENNYEKVFQFDRQGYNHSPRILFIEFDKNGSLWIMVNHDLVYKIGSNGVTDLITDWGQEIIAISVFDSSAYKGYILDQYNGIRKFNITTGKTEYDEKLDTLNKRYSYPTVIYNNNASEYWIGYNNGRLVKLNTGSFAVIDYSHLIEPNATGAIRELFIDKTGVMWVGTNYEIIKFFPGDELFEKYLFVPSSENIAKKKSMRGIIEDEKGDVYAGGYSGLFKLNKKTNQFERFRLIDRFGKENNNYAPFRLLNDTSGYIWITSEGYGLYRFNKKNKKFEFPVHMNPANSKQICAMYSVIEWGKEELLLGTSRGLLIYNKPENTLKRIKTQGDVYDVSELEIMDIEKDKEGKVWVGSYHNGLFKWDSSSGITEYYSVSTTSSLSHNSVTDLFTDSSGNLWIGTRGGGLNKMDSNKKIKYYAKKDGLSDDIVAGIIQGNKDILWVSTFNGLSKLNTDDEKFENYFEKDGLNDNEFNIASNLKTQDGKIFMGGLNGLNAFYPYRLKRKEKEGPLLFLTKVTRHDGGAGSIIESSGDLSYFKKMDLSYKDKFFSFHFALADYYDRSGNSFHYKLEGYDINWNNLGDQNYVRFNNMPAGDYLLKIRGFNNQGVASMNTLVIPIYISSAVYTRTWFIVLIFLLAVGLAYIVFNYRLRQQLKLQQLRTKISSDLHDEVGSLLTRVSVQAELTKQGIYDGEDKKNALDKIAQTSRMATSAMNDVLWSIDARNDKMGNLLDHMREHADEVLGIMDIDVEFEIENINMEKEIEAVIRQNLFLIFKEAIHNIAKHSGASRVMVKLENRERNFFMIIKDDGVNTVEEGKKYQKGQGLKNMEMRAKKMNASFTAVNKNGFVIMIKRKSFC